MNSGFLERQIQHRINVLKVSQNLSALHIGPALSCVDIVDFIFYTLLQNQSSNDFILSKGHGAMALYAIQFSKGIITEDQFLSICQKNSNLGGHPDRGNPGVFASTGSLGHGLPIALGICLARKERKIMKDIYLVLSDGELMEGSNWEALLLAPSLGIKNICIFIDHNKSISRGNIDELHPNFLPIKEKLSIFGWEVEECDGHNQIDILQKYEQISAQSIKPRALVCNTVKGKGITFMENNPIWAYRSPNKEEYELAMGELENQLNEIKENNK